MSSLALAGRATVSLAVVLGLMWLVARMLRGRGAGRGVGALEVVSRQSLGRSGAVTVVRVGERALVLGVTETQITLLGETDLAAVVTELATPAEVVGQSLPVVGQPLPVARQPLAGSILSPTTWRSTVEVLRERSVRRG